MSVRPSLPYQGIARRALAAEAALPFDHDVIIIDTDDEIGKEETIASNKFKGLMGAFGAAMAAPIRRNLDLHGIARKVFMVEQLPQGALPTYDRDIDVGAMIKGDDE